MINKNNEVYEKVSTALRNKYSSIYVIGASITDTPPKFPAVSIRQVNNRINSNYSTFDKTENVVVEHYQVEVYSNLETGKEAQALEVTEAISDVMCELGYIRTFCEPVANMDTTLARRISRYEKDNVI